jgi:hypothetical protein
MRTLGKITAALGVVGAIAVAGVAPASADWYGYHRHHGYYDYGRGYYDYGRACPRGFSLQGGNCAPYQGPRGPYAPRGSRFWWQ